MSELFIRHCTINTESSDGDCSPGYYCTRGAADGKGNVGKFGGEGGICPVGSYCPAGSSIVSSLISDYLNVANVVAFEMLKGNLQLKNR